jgi:hypothetical protein
VSLLGEAVSECRSHELEPKGRGMLPVKGESRSTRKSAHHHHHHPRPPWINRVGLASVADALNRTRDGREAGSVIVEIRPADESRAGGTAEQRRLAEEATPSLQRPPRESSPINLTLNTMAASARPPAAEPLIFSLVSSSLLLLSTASSFLCSVGAGGGGATASLFGVVLSWSSLRSDHNFLAQTEEGGGGESCKRANADELAGGSSYVSSKLTHHLFASHSLTRLSLCSPHVRLSFSVSLVHRPTSSFLPFLLLLLLLLSLLQHLLHAYLLFGELHLFGSLPHLICRSPGSRAEEGWKSGDVFGSLAWRRKWRAAARSVGLIGGLGAVIIVSQSPSSRFTR